MSGNPVKFLYPSTLFVSGEEYLVDTILGSCVSVCMYDHVKMTGGINHYMLPLWNGFGLASPKYGNIAISKLLEKMLSLGCSQTNIIAKVFGGGNVIDTVNSQFMIGERNVLIAQDLLREMQIKITGSSVGGNLGRKIQFNTVTGEVKQKLIVKASSNEFKTEAGQR